MARKTHDALLVRLLDQQALTQQRAETCYRRLKRAFNALEKCRRQLHSLARRIARRRQELDAA